MATSKREQLVQTALKLFSSEGFHATGIDRILAESGVAKMTLYNHFKSKDELILAALRLRDEQFRNSFMKDVERKATDPIGRLLAMFDVLADWCGSKGFTGCTFINASAEFSGIDNPIHQAAAEHKHLLLNYIRQLTQAADLKNPQELADQLSILMDGAVVTVQVTGDCKITKRARSAAEILIQAAKLTNPQTA
ncbi:MAG: TetR/AcrR family transcriptional regulator [Planctomycetes bacterium]|nr:TetR/AcrR family transcriptional regulator [Planctomycetota bacterium]